jgi:4-hydroxy-4-methyl-2-oxoglutarate aldolase
LAERRVDGKDAREQRTREDVVDDMRAALSELGSATLGESGGQAMRDRVRAAWPGAVLVAPATPVVCTPGDNLAIHVAVASAPGGSALVVTVGDVPELGYWGEVLTTAAQSRGIAGLVIDGGVRDISALERLGFPVFSSTIALRGATKLRDGTVGATANVGDVDVSLGDWVVGDADGVTIVALEKLDDVLAAGRARAQKESHMFEQLKAGRTTIDLLDLDPTPITVTL